MADFISICSLAIVLWSYLVAYFEICLNLAVLVYAEFKIWRQSYKFLIVEYSV